MKPCHGRTSRANALFAVVAALLCLISLPMSLAAASPPNILLLTSYHHGDPWSDEQVAGFRGAFAPDEARIFIEHLDARRLPLVGAVPEFPALLQAKYHDTPMDLLVAIDDAALDFWLANRDRLFPGLPLVFCGINDFTAKRIAGHDNITGVNESPNILGTLELALGLMPSAHVVVAIGNDQDITSRTNLSHFRRAATALGRRIRTIEILNATVRETQAALAGMSKDTIVLRFASVLDENRAAMPIDTDFSSLAASSPAPMFALWDFDLGQGALGGQVVRGMYMGRAAAAIAKQILAGTPASAIPVADTPTEAVLDEEGMKRFGISPSRAPVGTVFINGPASAYERYKVLIWCILAALAVSLPASILLGATLAGRRRIEAKLAENERRYRELVENAHALILRFDAAGRLVFVNEYAERLLGYTREELLGGTVNFWPTSPANLSGLLARAMAAPETLAAGESENQVIARDGRQVYIHWDNQVLLGDDGRPEGWLAVGSDITARRLAEDALAARVLAEEELSAFGRELLTDAPGAVNRAFKHLLTALSVDRANWFENLDDPEFGRCCRLVAEVCSAGQEPKIDHPAMARIPYELDGFRWADTFAAGDTISGLAEDFPESVQSIFKHFGVQAVLAAPVVVNGVWSGFLVAIDARKPRSFSRFEQTLLVTAASLLSAHLSRPHA
jgi:PAS domain S-box-containing protein